MLIEIIREAWVALRRNYTRSFLTMLGIVWGIATVTLLEVGFSARSAADLRSGADRALLDAMPVEYLTPRSEDRAAEVQALLADRGQHRAAAIPDLLIAALAELAGLRVLHHDRDFELIAGVTDQPVERLAVA